MTLKKLKVEEIIFEKVIHDIDACQLIELVVENKL